jgi:hypothetical protein
VSSVKICVKRGEGGGVMEDSDGGGGGAWFWDLNYHHLRHLRYRYGLPAKLAFMPPVMADMGSSLSAD